MSAEKTIATRAGLLATGLAVVFAGSLAMPKEADAVVVIAPTVAASAAAAAAASAHAARIARERRVNEGLGDYIATQSEASLQKAVQNGFSSYLTPYAGQCLASLERPENLRAENVTQTLRSDFVSCLKGEALIAQMGAKSPEVATKLGMDSSLSPYFSQCQKESGIAPGDHDLTRAIEAKDCMERNHSEDIKGDILTTGALIAGGLALAGVSYELRRRSRWYY